MIVNSNTCRLVEWEYQDPNGGVSILSIPLDVYLVFVEQAKSLEELRVLCFGWPTRKTANSLRKKIAATVGFSG